MKNVMGHAGSKGLFAVMVAGLVAACGCHQTRYNWVLNGVDVSLPPMASTGRPIERAGTPAELLAVRPGGSKTMLITSQIRDNPETIDDERARTFICVLDGPPVVGKEYKLDVDNCRFVLNEVFRPCRQPYQGAEGEVTIKSVEAGKVKAHVVFRNVIRSLRSDSFIIRETMTFKPVAADDVRLRQAGIAYEAASAAGSTP